MRERQKILIVDDREENLFALEKTLQETGAESIKAASGDEALAATLHHDFALAILDVQMPGMNGFELAELLRSDEKTLSLPIIFLTAAFAEDENVLKGYEFGAVDYIIKPFNPVVLNGKVRAFLELARYRKQLEDMVQERTNSIQHINQILRGVRNVSQLIVREQDSRRLIRKTCRLLVETRGFDGAWIAVVGGSGNLVDIAHDGFGEGFALFTERIRSGVLPPCLKETRQTGGVIVRRPLEANCGECPLRSNYGTSHAMTTSLEHEGTMIGFMGLVVPAAMATDEEEQTLFQEVAGDIAYALRNIQVGKEREAAVKALRDSEELHRVIFNNASVGIDLVDRYGRFLEVNDTLSKFLGYRPGELRKLCTFDVTHPDDLSRSKELHETMVRGEEKNYRFEKRFVRKDGVVFWTDTAASAVRDGEGEYRATVQVISDITQRKKSEEARIRLASAVEQAAEIVEMTDPQGTIVYVNPAFERTTGYSREEAVGKNPRILKSGLHDDKFYKRMWKTLTDGKTWTGHVINRKKDGTLFEEDVSISPVKDHSGKIVNYVAVKRDATMEVTLQKQLIQAQKMEAVGTLAGGVAHDFNNILQVALGYSELLLGHDGMPPRYKADLQKINDAARRGADLVQRLLTFSRKTEAQPRPLNLNRRVREVRKMLDRIIPKMIEIQLSLAEDLAAINADATQVDQVLMNLAVNARDAMPEGGKLAFETANVFIDAESAASHIKADPGHYVVLTVTDTGSGIDQSTLQHIFEPFYTTKETSKGTGLGLAMVYGIVHHHGGVIRCHSELDRGTTFKIYFPALVSDEELEHEPTKALPRGGSETILLADDEEVNRDLGSRILSKSGYEVITASDGKEALEIYERRGGEIALVILDLIMPNMGGRQCLEALLGLNPSTKVVIASGYSVDALTKEALTSWAKGFVNKPYDIRQVLQVVRDVLDAE